MVMRSRGGSPVLRTLALLLVVLGLIGPALRHASAQDALPAAIVEGTCDTPGDVAAELDPLAIAEGGLLTSFTTIDLATGELTSGGYAVAVGDPQSPAACGEIAGQADDVYVEVPARADSRFSGIAWFHARDDRTQVSLFIGENLAATADAEPTEEPDDAPEPPTEATPAPTRQAGRTTTYTAPTFGYTIIFNTNLWDVVLDESTPDPNGTMDALVLSAERGSVQVEFYGGTGDPSLTAAEMADRMAHNLAADPGHDPGTIRTGADGQAVHGDETRAYAVVDFPLPDDGSDPQINTYYVEVWKLPTNDAFLTMFFQTPQTEEESWTTAREALEQGINVGS